MKAVYIHGFAGSIHSDTITNFRKYYPDLEWCPLEVNHLVDESVKKINDFLAANPDVKYLIGSSLGGFYVLCADFAGRKVVINPEEFAGYDKNNDKIFWMNGDGFHMKKSVVEEEITLCGIARWLGIETTDNTGIGIVPLT